MNCWKVYCYTGENGKKYIGITSRSLYERAGKDGYCYTHNQNGKFSNAIKKYGFNFFTPEILEDNLSEEKAKELEQYYIEYYDSYNNGYNTTMGGDGNVKVDREYVVQLWNEGKGITEIKKITGYGDPGIQTALNLAGISGIDRIKREAGKYHICKI